MGCVHLETVAPIWTMLQGPGTSEFPDQKASFPWLILAKVYRNPSLTTPSTSQAGPH